MLMLITEDACQQYYPLQKSHYCWTILALEFVNMFFQMFWMYYYITTHFFKKSAFTQLLVMYIMQIVNFTCLYYFMILAEPSLYDF